MRRRREEPFIIASDCETRAIDIPVVKFVTIMDLIRHDEKEETANRRQRISADEIDVEAARKTLTDLVTFLASSIFPDIGPVTANRIVSAFGVRTAQIIETSPRKLLEVDGVGMKRMESARRGWSFQPRLAKELGKFTRLASSGKVSIPRDRGDHGEG